MINYREAIAGLNDPRTGQLPVDIEGIAESQGIKIKYVPLDPDVSGVLLTEPSGEIIIGVNEGHHINRQRFTIAHEFGHFLLHKERDETLVSNLLTSKEVVYFRNEDSSKGEHRREVQANQFAAELLMPEDLIRLRVGTKIKQQDETMIRDLSSEFMVSVQSMMFRLINLQLLDSLLPSSK